MAPHDSPGPARSTGSPAAVLALMSTGMFLVLLDVTIVNVALPSIGSSLHASLVGLQWVVDGYSVPFAALLLAAGGFADRIGARRLVLTGLGLFGVASLLCGAAPTAETLVVARAAQGVGAAALLPASLALILRAYPARREQARALGLWTGTSSLALPAGPILGGVLTEALGWRSVFLLNVPVVLVALALARRLIGQDERTRAGHTDVAGAVLATTLLGASVLAVVEAGAGWLSPLAGLVAVAAVVAFVGVERRAQDPMLPLRLVGRRPFVSATAVAALMNFVGIGSILVLTLFLQGVQHRSPTGGGVALLPLFAPLALLAPLTGRIVARVGPRLPMVAGLLCGAVGSASLLGVEADSAYVGVLPALLGLGLGMGLLTAAVVSAAVRALPASASGLASGINNAARQTGGAVGIAVYGAVAGSPAHAGFVSGLHRVGLLGALAWLAAILLVSPVDRIEA